MILPIFALQPFLDHPEAERTTSFVYLRPRDAKPYTSAGKSVPVFTQTAAIQPIPKSPISISVSAVPLEPKGLKLAKSLGIPLLDPALPQVPKFNPLLDAVATTGRAAVPLTGSKTPQIEDMLCDVVCSKSDLSSVLSMLSTSTHANVVTLATSEEKLSLSLRRVRFVEALKLISGTVGMSFLKVGNAFVVGPGEKLKASYPKEWEKANPTPKEPTPKGADTSPAETNPSATVKPVEPIKTTTFQLSHSIPAQMVESLKMLFADQGLTVVVGPASYIPTLTDKNASESTGVTTGVLSTDDKPNGKLLILRGPTSVVASAIEAIKSLDQARAQVAIEVTIFDVTDDALNELGVSWNIGGTSFQESTHSGVGFGSFSRTPLNFGATIKALETADKAKILASPNVSVLDNERAFILIGNKITLPKFDGYDANKIPIYSTNEYRVGIYLQVSPSVATDGTITLAIYPQVSTVVKTTEINGASYPDIATREAQTTLRVKNGESIVLGGLLKNEELEQLERVPILSKIPIFGELFTRRKKTKSSSQVIITLTPRLIATEGS